MQSIFERYEIKYLLTKKQYNEVLRYINLYLDDDKYGDSTIQSIYFDTDSNFLIRSSIDKSYYKEKLRLRSYGIADENKEVFLEIKKKYNHKVYKRRINIKEKDAFIFLNKYNPDCDNQIAKEISYMKYYYKDLKPKMLLIYDRKAFYKEDLRVTFDTNIRYRIDDLSLSKGLYGNKVLDDDFVLMEIKTSSSIPLWLVKVLSENKIYKTSFSKYKEAYKKECKEENKYVRINI